MLRKISILFMAVVAMLLASLDVTACPYDSSVAHETMLGQDEVYSGRMDVTMSEGKIFRQRPATFIISKGKLTCDFPKMGKMPGKICISLPVTCHADGSITTFADTIAGYVKMPLGLKIKLKVNSITETFVSSSRLCFILKVYGQFMGKKFPTTINFSGDRI